MLQNVNAEKFAETLKQSYKTMNDVSATNLASKLIAELDERLEDAVLAWIEGKDIPNVSHDEYSISKILAYKNSHDYLMAIRFLSEYIKDPIEGKKQICRPIHSRPFT